MGLYIGYNKILITTEPKTFYFDLPKDVENSLKHDIYSVISVIKHTELLLVIQ